MADWRLWKSLKASLKTKGDREVGCGGAIPPAVSFHYKKAFLPNEPKLFCPRQIKPESIQVNPVQPVALI
jgi:hypothetical protein